VGFSPSGPMKANRGIRARVPSAGKVLEGDDQRTLSPLYYDLNRMLILMPTRNAGTAQTYAETTVATWRI